jgi:hypothetical protein
MPYLPNSTKQFKVLPRTDVKWAPTVAGMPKQMSRPTTLTWN